MKNCPNCGAQIKDDSLFCTECGKPIPQGSVCPHCGASVNDGDSFCQKCGKSINEPPCEEIITNDEEKKNGIKKYLPYVLGAFVLLMIIGYCSSNESSKESRNEGSFEQVTDSINIDKDKESSEQEIQAKKDFLEKFYKEKDGREQSDEYAYIKKNVTANGLQNLKDLYDFECDGECLATWVFDYDSGSDIGDIKSSKIIHQDGNDFLVENEYEYAKYSVLLTVVKEGGTYKIDKIEQKESSYYPPEQEETETETENLDWLQGHWVYEQGNYKGHFIIQGNTITQYSSMNPKADDATFRIEDGAIRARLIDGMDLVVPIDFANHRIDYGDGNWMHKVE